HYSVVLRTTLLVLHTLLPLLDATATAECPTLSLHDALPISVTPIETGSVSAAARQLKTPLPTVSRKVFELESHLRTKLFNRSSRKDQQPKQRSSEIADMIHYSPSWRVGRHFTLSSPPTLFADHAAPCRKPFSRMLIHPVGELRCAH